MTLSLHPLHRFPLLTCSCIATNAFTMLIMACHGLDSLVKVTTSSILVISFNMLYRNATDRTLEHISITFLQKLITNQQRFQMETNKALVTFNIQLCKKKRNVSSENTFCLARDCNISYTSCLCKY
jgi:hypothetical protein